VKGLAILNVTLHLWVVLIQWLRFLCIKKSKKLKFPQKKRNIYACFGDVQVLKIGFTEHTHDDKMQNIRLITLKLNLLLLLMVSGD
jgi:hypothetical protein